MAARMDLYQRAGGVITPVLTALFAFFVGGLVVLFTTGKNPIDTYKAIFNGTGLNWFFPWVRGQERFTAGLNLQQTLIITTTLILVGLAVAFAFRCGLFNIGGQGQYIVGAMVSAWVGSSWAGMAKGFHIPLAIALAALAGAAWAGIAGFLLLNLTQDSSDRLKELWDPFAGNR
jgi:simple sugar transport system permease protein